jgi:hypothetical protein
MAPALKDLMLPSGTALMPMRVGSTGQRNVVDFTMFRRFSYGPYWSAWLVGRAEAG